MGPKETERRIMRVASAVERSSSPSLSKLSAEIGKVVLALEDEPGSPAGSPAGSPEGALGVPVGQMVAHLQSFLAAKYRIDASYRSFADRVRGPWRDSLVAHWQEHAGEERDQAYAIAMKISGLGGDPSVTVIEVPQVPANVGAMFATLMGLEIKAIENARKTIEMSGSMTSLKVLAEDILLKDTHHLDDLRRMAPEALT